MRKALIGLILAATAITPVAAEAQRGHRDGNRGGESRAARIEQRNEARQTESSPPPQQAQPQQQQQQQPPPPVAQRQRGGDGGGNRSNWRGNDNNNNNNGGNRGGGGDGNRRGRSEQPSIYPQAWQGNPNDPRLRHYQELERRNQNRYGGGDRNGRNDRDGRNWRNDRNDRDGRVNRRGDRRGDWNRSWRNDRRYDWNNWRRHNRHFFHLSPYYSPYRNYGYSRFSIGLFLEPLFYGQRYWIGDPWQYRLPAAPYGTQWVRYYNDVLLIDIQTGEVIDVIYDFFW